MTGKATMVVTVCKLSSVLTQKNFFKHHIMSLVSRCLLVSTCINGLYDELLAEPYSSCQEKLAEIKKAMKRSFGSKR